MLTARQDDRAHHEASGDADPEVPERIVGKAPNEV